MCFRIQYNVKESLTADKDIVVYKILYKKENKYISLYQYFKYKPNKIYRLKKKLKLIDSINIEEGFHSYNEYEVKRKYILPGFRKEIVRVECIIPKGSQYYFNGYLGEYVSNSLSLIGEYLD